MALTTTIALQDGVAAATNLANGAVAYVTPGNMLTITPQVSTGMIQWNVVLTSDYPPLSQQTFTSFGPTFQVNVPLPQASCKFGLVSEATDGNNFYQSVYTLYNYARQTATLHAVRYVCTSNVNTANVNVVQDGVTGVAGDRILLVAQATTSQNGPWLVGTVAANLTALTRPADWQSAATFQAPQTFAVSEGTTWNMSNWRVQTTGNVTVDTTNISLYPQVAFRGNVANLSANGNITGLFLISNTTTAVSVVSLNTVNASPKVTVVNAVAGGAAAGFVTIVPGNANDAGNVLILNF